jgi:hypothetical protein
MVYRYFNLTHGLEALQTEVWKIGRLDELNDIFDCRPNMVNHTVQPGTPTFTDDEYLKSLSGILGLLCYSATINDPVIWSHYADKHQGIALGFEFGDLETELPYEVRYSKNRPVLDFAKIGTFPEDRDPVKAKKRLIDAGFTSKHPSWAYEREYRHFVPLDVCQMKGRHYFKSIPWGQLREVVLGAKCTVTMQDVDRIISEYHARALDERQLINLPRSQIRQCKMNTSSFDLDFDDFPRHPSTY